MSSRNASATNIDETERFATTSTNQNRRVATLYDAVAGRVGPNGFLSDEQCRNRNVTPLTPEEVLVRRINGRTTKAPHVYDAARDLNPEQTLPDSDLLKDIHAYASHFYHSRTDNGGEFDFRSMDETALLAMGILAEESMREALGETGDLALTEPEGLEQGLPLSRMAQHQVVGRVVPQPVREYRSLSPVESEEPAEGRRRKRRRRHLTEDT